MSQYNFPTLLLDLDWIVHNELCGSNHFPFFLNNIDPDIVEQVLRRKLNKANFRIFVIRDFMWTLPRMLMIL